MSDPAEGPRQVGEMVEAGVHGMSTLSTTLIAGSVVLGALLVWIVFASLGETLKDRRRK